MLKIENLTKIFNIGETTEKTALNNVSLTLEEGDFLTIIGGNGAGKSTLLNCISGVLSVDNGTISLDGEDVTHLAEYKRAKYVSRVFQNNVFSVLKFLNRFTFGRFYNTKHTLGINGIAKCCKKYC